MGVSNVFKIGLMVPNCSKDFMFFNDNSNNIARKEDHEKNDINITAIAILIVIMIKSNNNFNSHNNDNSRKQ